MSAIRRFFNTGRVKGLKCNESYLITTCHHKVATKVTVTLFFSFHGTSGFRIILTTHMKTVVEEVLKCHYTSFEI